jgi:hypothetical protein
MLYPGATSGRSFSPANDLIAFLSMTLDRVRNRARSKGTATAGMRIFKSAKRIREAS